MSIYMSMNIRVYGLVSLETNTKPIYYFCNHIMYPYACNNRNE